MVTVTKEGTTISWEAWVGPPTQQLVGDRCEGSSGGRRRPSVSTLQPNPENESWSAFPYRPAVTNSDHAAAKPLTG